MALKKKAIEKKNSNNWIFFFLFNIAELIRFVLFFHTKTFSVAF